MLDPLAQRGHFGPASISSGHKGVRSALARSANQIETSPPSELFHAVGAFPSSLPANDKLIR